MIPSLVSAFFEVHVLPRFENQYRKWFLYRWKMIPPYMIPQIGSKVTFRGLVELNVADVKYDFIVSGDENYNIVTIILTGPLDDVARLILCDKNSD